MRTLHVSHLRTFLPKRLAVPHGSSTEHPRLTATAGLLHEADQGELHDAYVYSVNAAVGDGREDLADELARSYAREARRAGRDRAAATQMLLLANR